MEGALIIGVIPVLYSAASDKSGDNTGRTLWLGLIAVYGIVLYVVRIPWQQIYDDFYCHGNITYPCLMECFEQLFTISISEMWCFFYFICITTFFLMEFLMAQIQHRHLKKKMKSMQQTEKSGEMEKGSLRAIRKRTLSQQKVFLNFLQERELLYVNLLHLLLQVSIQMASFCLLIFKQLPMVSQENIHCSTDGCPGPYQCLIWEPSEKQLSVYTLTTFSMTVIVLGTVAFVYSIYHHLLMAHSAFKD